MKTIVAVIQAGGLGTRMKELTGDKIPKPMLEMNGKPMLQWQIEALINFNITEIVIIVGHLGEKICSYFGDGTAYGIKINYIVERELLGSGGSLYYLKDYPADDYLFIFGDVLFDMDIHRLISFHRKREGMVTLVSHPNNHPYDSDLLITDRCDAVIGFLWKKEKRENCYSNLVNSGISIFSKKVIDEIEVVSRMDYEKDIVQKYIHSGGVFSYRTSEYIKDTGTPERFRQAAYEQEKGICERSNLRNKQKCVFLDRDGTVNELRGLISDPIQFELCGGASEAIKLLNASGILAIVVTNQPVVARGLCSEEDVRAIHSKMEMLLGAQGAFLDDIAFCPHHPDKGFPEENPAYKIPCTCRKPATGLIDKMVQKYNISLSESYIVGDTTVDMKTGENAGMHTVLLRTGEAGKDKKYDVKPEIIADDLLAAVKEILRREGL